MNRHVHSAIEHSKQPRFRNEYLPMVQADRKTLADEVERLENMLLFALDQLGVGLVEFTEHFEAAEAEET